MRTSLVVPRQTAIDHVQVDVLASQSHDANEPLPAVALVPVHDDMFARYLLAQLARACLSPGLVLFGRIDSGHAYLMLRTRDLDDNGVAVDNPDHPSRQVLSVGSVTVDEQLNREQENKD